MKTRFEKELRPADEPVVRREGDLDDLVVAVLEDAMKTYKQGIDSPVPARRVEAFRVEAWVASDDTDWPFAFVNVCEAVGLDPDYVRACMKRWRRGAQRSEPWAN
jgi:hypothetical protein